MKRLFIYILLITIIASFCFSEEKKAKIKHLKGKGDSVVIDEISITLKDIKVSKVKEDIYGIEKNTKYLVFNFILKNTSASKILNVNWSFHPDRCLMKDNFDNVYKYVTNNYKKGRLIPGESTLYMVIFDKPIKNAETFTLKCDPYFHRLVDIDKEKEISNDTLVLSFSKKDL